MEIVIKQISLINFKGLSGTWALNKKENEFRGKNGTGKTTLLDAELWLRTGKNSLGQTDFDIKKVADSKANHSVEVTYIIDGEELTLTRSYAEKWTKQRGSAQAVLTGHTTTYRINDQAKISKRDFDAKVNEVFGGEKYQLVSDPFYFVKLKWEERRRLLTELSSEVDKDEIIDSIDGLREVLGEMREILGEMTVDQLIERVKESKKHINKDLENIPARIEEHESLLSKIVGDVSLEQVVEAGKKLSVNIQVAEEKLADWKADNSLDHNENLNVLNDKLRESIESFQEEKNEAFKKSQELKAKKEQAHRDLNNHSCIIQTSEEATEKLREEYKKLAVKTFLLLQNKCFSCGEVITCPHCKEKAAAEAEANFNKKKAERLKEIQVEGKELNSYIEELKAVQIKYKAEYDELDEIPDDLILSLLESGITANLKMDIEKFKSNIQTPEPPLELSEKIEQLKIQANDHLEIESDLKANAASHDRITELEKQKIALSKEFDEVEKSLSLAERYNKTLAEKTEEGVNDLFKCVKFKMFHTQINGAISPVCDIINKSGCSYERAMSNGERIKAGLDIVGTFSRHYGIQAPIFIDNAEAVTEFPELETQVIKLCVSEAKDHHKLTQIGV